jgi:hypothetical protein
MNKAAEVVLNLFIQLVDIYLSKKMTGAEFQALYFDLWRKYQDTSEHLEINSATNESIDRMFVSLDCYCSDAMLRDDGDLDDDQLFEEIKDIAEDLTLS